ncbi:MAG: hypothetical protein PHE87_06150 [Victivallaceae bacterium]|nr:hypothetical protein [Victivallaceae bacterium]
MNDRRIKNEITIGKMAEYRKILGELKPGVVVEVYDNAPMQPRWLPYEVVNWEPIRESCDGRSVLFTAIDLARKGNCGDTRPSPMSVKYEFLRIKKGGE